MYRTVEFWSSFGKHAKDKLADYLNENHIKTENIVGITATQNNSLVLILKEGEE